MNHSQKEKISRDLKFFVSRNYSSQYNASGKAKIDCEMVLERNGWKNIGFRRSYYKNGLFGTVLNLLGIVRVLVTLPPESTLCLQYPYNKFYHALVKIALLKRCRLVTIIHDIKSLKKLSPSTLPDPKEISLLSSSMILIAHNERMKAWLRDQGLEMPIFCLGIFDYLIPELPIPKMNSYPKDTVIIAGSLSPKKNSFIYDLDKIQSNSIKFNLYGKGFNPSRMPPHSDIYSFKGFFPSDELPNKIEGGFGLVWDGSYTDTCGGYYGEYLRYNNPHKCSFYLACGLPVIIWREAALAKFIKQKQVGLCVDSLHEIPTAIRNLSDEAYNSMRAHITNIQSKIRTGDFLDSVLKEIAADFPALKPQSRSQQLGK